MSTEDTFSRLSPSLLNDNTEAKPLPKPALPNWLLSSIQRGFTYLVRWWWAWEVLSITISLCATGALIGLLAYANNRTQDPSGLFGGTQLSLNTYIAVISTVIRASLAVAIAGALNQSAWNRFSSKRRARNNQPSAPLKDWETFGNAASDVWGSLALIWRTKSLNLAALGAWVVVFSLAFDAFVQQVVTVNSEQIVDTAITSELGSDSMLPMRKAYINEILPPRNEGEYDAPTAAKGAIMSAILQRNQPFPLATCPTRNCTWPVTPTVGLCSTCSDVKDELSFVEGESRGSYGNLTLTLPWGDSTTNTFREEDVTLLLQSSVVGGVVNITILSTSTGTGVAENGHLILASIYVIGVSPIHFEEFQAMFVPPSSPYTFDSIIPYISAYNCSMYICLQTYSGNMTSGDMQQSLIQSWDQMSAVGEDESAYLFANVPESMGISNASEYTIDRRSKMALGAAIQPIIRGSVIVDDIEFRPIYRGLGGGPPGNQNTIGGFVQTFHDHMNSTETITALMEQIATGTTNYFRTSSDAAMDERFAPSVLQTRIFIRVEWAWLAFPLGLLVAGQVFLAATIVQTRGMRVLPWKNHKLSLLLASVDEDIIYRATGGLRTKNGLRDRVGNIMVKLNFDEQDQVLIQRAT